MVLCPSRKQRFSKQVIGFDIETAGDDATFVCAAVVGEGFAHCFFDRMDCIRFLCQDKFSGAIVIATQLGYDLFGLFGEYASGLRMCWNGSRLLWAKTWPRHNRPSVRPTKHGSIQFWDTLNIAPMSVEKLGKLIGLKKLPHPQCFTRFPRTAEERDELIAYNIRDAQISREAFMFFTKTYSDLGASIRPTLPSMAMSAWRNFYLDRTQRQPAKRVLRWMFAGYYGGRTEAFARGEIRGLNFYDINSLYPHVMLQYAYPDMNTLRHNQKARIGIIQQYEGMCDAVVHVPKMRYPPLCVRYDLKHGQANNPDSYENTRLVFPTGTIKGRWTFAELRHAISCGCTIMDVGEAWYTLESWRPFLRFVEHFYGQRKTWRNDNDPREQCAKLMMNSLYGKFGQKFDGRENLEPAEAFTWERLNTLPWFERVGPFIRYADDGEPAQFCNPLWAAYVTSYARIELHRWLVQSNALYCDTDSIITAMEIPTSGELGKLKLEMAIDYGVIIRPKFYGIRGMIPGKAGTHEKVKCKGYGARMPFALLYDVIRGKTTTYAHVIKLRESLRRGLKINSTVISPKTFSLEDTKRQWPADFSLHELQWSEPLHLEDNQLTSSPQSHNDGRPVSLSLTP